MLDTEHHGSLNSVGKTIENNERIHSQARCRKNWSDYGNNNKAPSLHRFKHEQGESPQPLTGLTRVVQAMRMPQASWLVNGNRNL